MGHVMKAKELPAARHEQIKALRSDLGITMFRYFAKNDLFMGSDFYRDRGDELREREIRRWNLAELYFVTQDMTAVALAAAPTLPNFRLQREDLPSEQGFIYFETPIDESEILGEPGGSRRTQVVGCLWGVEHGLPHGGVWMSFYANQSFTNAEAIRLGDFTVGEAAVADAIMPALGYDDEMIWKFNLDDSDQVMQDDASQITAIGKVVRSAWLLMQQPLASSRKAHVSHADAKRMRRNRIDPKTVRIISLRRAFNPDAHGDPEARRAYHHRWVVRGHWRNQPCGPGRIDRRPTWIPWHVKGPENAPLLTGEKVHAWRR